MDKEIISENHRQQSVSSGRGAHRWIAYVLVVAIVVAASGYVINEGIELPTGVAQSSGPPAGVGTKIGMLAPDFQLRDLAGNEVKLSDFRGKAVMINFWATWCPPCRYEMPFMEAVYREKADQGLVILAVSIDDDPRAVEQFVKEFDLTFPVLLDTEKRVAFEYRVQPIPTTFFVDREGVIRDANIGAMEKKTILKKLAKIM